MISYNLKKMVIKEMIINCLVCVITIFVVKEMDDVNPNTTAFAALMFVISLVDSET